MKNLIIQLKTVFRDKISILSFLLPIIMAILILNVEFINIKNMEELNFGVIKNELNEKEIQILESIGHINFFKDRKKLYSSINEPNTETIGIIKANNDIQIIISGDESKRHKEISKSIPQILNQELEIDIREEKIEAKSPILEFKDIIYSMIILMSLFLGCTFNVMNIVSEIEEGIININRTLPMKFDKFLHHKILLSFIITTVLAMITTIILTNIQLLLKLMVIIILTSFISAILGLFIANFSDNYIIAITNLKLILTIFIALPIIIYAFFEDSKFSYLFYILPSYPVFQGILKVMNLETIDIEKLALCIQAPIYYLLAKYLQKPFNH
ncbi:MAG: ABC transporter permease [Tissierellia bacterium]|nr:ABC transporter permease [Tissierellia bacterium]